MDSTSFGGKVGGDVQRVLVLRGRGVQNLQALGKRLRQSGLDVLRGGGLGLRVQVAEQVAGVFGEQVDLRVLQGGQVDLAGTGIWSFSAIRN